MNGCKHYLGHLSLSAGTPQYGCRRISLYKGDFRQLHGTAISIVRCLGMEGEGEVRDLTVMTNQAKLKT